MSFCQFQMPDLNLDGGSNLKQNGSAKDLASVMESLKKNSLASRQNQSLNNQVSGSSSQQQVRDSAYSSRSK